MFDVPTNVAPILVFGWGNWSRSDDGLALIFIDRLAERLGDEILDRVEFLDDFQLQIEHALDLVGRQRVLFVDASVDCAPPFEVRQLEAERDYSYTTHAMSPAAIMQVFTDVRNCEPPPCTLLAIRGENFELGQDASTTALAHLDQAVDWAEKWVLDERSGHA